MTPLAGVRVLDLTRVVFGPLTTRMLADFGAEVWKVEPPQGDIGRQMGFLAAPGVSSIHLSCNGNKRDIGLDLWHPSARRVLLGLAAKADVFVHSMTQSTIAALGLAYPDVAEVNPSVIYANCWGFGRDGGYAGTPAYDDIIQGLSGLVALEPDHSGAGSFSPSILCDKVCALYALSGITAALYDRTRTGLGVELEFPMFEIMTAFNAVEHLDGRTFSDRATTGYRRAISPYRRPYRTTDGAVTILPYKDRHWRSVTELLGRPELATDSRLSTVAARQANPALVTGLLTEYAATRTSAAVLAALRESQVPAGPVHSLDDLIDDPHLAKVGFWRDIDHPRAGTVRLPGPPGRQGVRVSTPAPELGQHTESILAESGFSPDEIQELRRAGVVF
jgi:crotonobetainyl-CoA:carnitine CoA-transferase CaiB-like acyl-CoA transferase